MEEKSLKKEVKPEIKTVSSEKPKSKGLPTPLIIALGCFGLLFISGLIFSFAMFFIFKKGVENRTGLRIETQEGKEGISFEDKETGTKVNLGAQKIPDNFPSDFPIYPGAKPSGSLSGGQNAQKGFWLMLQSEDVFDKVESFYAANLKSKGWGGEEALRVGNSVTWKVEKGDLEGTVMVSREKDDKQTAILVILGTPGENQSEEETGSGSFDLSVPTE